MSAPHTSNSNLTTRQRPSLLSGLQKIFLVWILKKDGSYNFWLSNTHNYWIQAYTLKIVMNYKQNSLVHQFTLGVKMLICDMKIQITFLVSWYLNVIPICSINITSLFGLSSYWSYNQIAVHNPLLQSHRTASEQYILPNASKSLKEICKSCR